jgi:hypothetical protein
VILSDGALRKRLALAKGMSKRIVVEPMMRKAIQPGSIDVRLGESMRVWDRGERHWCEMELSEQGCWFLEPGRCYLGVLKEWLDAPCLVGYGDSGLGSHYQGDWDPQPSRLQDAPFWVPRRDSISTLPSTALPSRSDASLSRITP